MNKIDLKVDFKAVVKRINKEKQRFSPTEWAKNVGVSKSLVSTIHPKGEVKTFRKPSLEYIVLVSKFTRKSVLYYLYGPKDLSNVSELKRAADKKRQMEETREGILELFEDRQAARKIIVRMSEMAKEDQDMLKKIEGALAVLRPDPTKKTDLLPTVTNGDVEKKS